MSYHSIATATASVRHSDGAIERLADRFGVLALLLMGLAMAGVTALSGV